jgi:hypothetical protein
MPSKKYIEELEKSRKKNKNNLQNNICSWRTYQKELEEKLKNNDWKEEDIRQHKEDIQNKIR